MSVALALAAALVAPVPAPAVFVAGDYALTFHTPPRASICALPPDWVGSNHGTIIFLQPPRQCGGVGYPSSSRWFSNDVARIEVYYELYDPEIVLPACEGVAGRIRLIGKVHRVCRAKRGRDLRVSVSAVYNTYAPAWVEVALVTTPKRLHGDLVAFYEVISSLTPCKVSDGKSGSFGTGEPCPPGGSY